VCIKSHAIRRHSYQQGGQTSHTPTLLFFHLRHAITDAVTIAAIKRGETLGKIAMDLIVRRCPWVNS